jgi:hypothetical protein
VRGVATTASAAEETGFEAAGTEAACTEDITVNILTYENGVQRGKKYSSSKTVLPPETDCCIYITPGTAKPGIHVLACT